MTIISWCQEKIRRAYAACKRVILCRSDGNTEMDQDQVYHVDLPVRPGEQNPSDQLQVIGPLQRQRRRPDVQPIGMRRFADPEKVAALFKACKELRVPVGENRFKEGDDDSSGSAKTISGLYPQKNVSNQNGKK
ncbi:uncharacterized protein LOC126550443 [Aphis gossypii]|uniref:Uncharacterized protein n=1 Tax=Aphis gossypii TaxID=80765 RepID=A0A9P0NJC7_APHGO|nr:uncharacterized protein LOC126550443 [Aphis gossypii]CAH1721802.1 unnamed protein product [Aphis gossypii]